MVIKRKNFKNAVASNKKGSFKFKSKQAGKVNQLQLKIYASTSQMWHEQRRGQRRFTVVANWKMHLGDQHGLRLAGQIITKYQKIKPLPQLILCPPFTILKEIKRMLGKTDIKLGAQDVSGQSEGAHTGEVSASMLVAAGCEYVIVGHSERRVQLGESNDMVAQKLSQVLKHGLTPILCVGETWEQRQEDRSEVTVISQLQHVLNGLILPIHKSLLIVYEPVWAIGSGNPVSRDEAAHMAQLIRHLIVDGKHFNFTCTQPEEQIKILYGGSVNAKNVQQFDMPGIIDGVLVGGVSLEAEQFIALSKVVS